MYRKVKPTQRCRKAIIRAVRIVGGTHASLAQAVGVAQPSITCAIRRGTCSPSLALAIERATGGNVPKHILCPEIFDVPGVAQ